MRTVFALFAIGVVIGLALFATPSSAEAARPLFTLLETPNERSGVERSSIGSVLEAAIRIDPAAFRSRTIAVTTFVGKSYTAAQLASEGMEVRGADDLTWRGRIEQGKFTGDVILTYKKGYVSGLVYSPESVYEIVPKGDQQILVKLDQSLFPSCAGGVKGEEARSAAPAAPQAGVDSGDRIDALALYTAAVRTSAGGDVQAQTIAQQAVDAANTSYINSKIRQRVRLVNSQLTALNETGDFSSELSSLRADTTAAGLRNTFNADLVDMLTNSTAACGIGYLMGGQGGNQNNGFTVTARTCAVGNLSFAHELGHNMGSQHNPENGSNPTYPYGFGHYVNGNYRTVMSYVDPCPSGCTRVAYFSNPAVSFNGFATGLENARDNARSINNTADWISNYRYSGSSLTLGNFSGDEIVGRMTHQSLVWTSDNAVGDVKIEISQDGGTTWTTMFNPTPNDNQEYIILGTRMTKRARIRITSLSNPAVSDSSVANFSIR